MTPEQFKEWLCREMPAGTIIGDPAWWAPRIYEKAKAPPEATGCALCKSPDGIHKSLLSRLYDRFGAYSEDSLWLEVSAFMTGRKPVEPAPAEARECETCHGEGTIDERLGGYSFSNPAAKCPDCDGVGEYQSTTVEPGETCAWAYVDDGSWLTNCGETAILDNGGTAYSDMRFCCFCGKPTP